MLQVLCIKWVCLPRPSVVTQVVQSANAKQIGNSESMKGLFRTAYMMSANEIPHTTNWRAMMSTLLPVIRAEPWQVIIENVVQTVIICRKYQLQPSLNLSVTPSQMTWETRVAGMQEFSLIADECTDTNPLEMVSIRKLKHAQVSEILIGCWPVKSTCAVDVTEWSRISRFGS